MQSKLCTESCFFTLFGRSIECTQKNALRVERTVLFAIQCPVVGTAKQSTSMRLTSICSINALVPRSVDHRNNKALSGLRCFCFCFCCARASFANVWRTLTTDGTPAGNVRPILTWSRRKHLTSHCRARFDVDHHAAIVELKRRSCLANFNNRRCETMTRF